MIVLAVLFALSGWSCLCFTMERHRRVVRALHWQRGTAILLRAAGIVLLVSALGPLAAVWPLPIAIAAWFAVFSLAQLLFVMFLTYQPRATLGLAIAGVPIVGLGLFLLTLVGRIRETL